MEKKFIPLFDIFILQIWKKLTSVTNISMFIYITIKCFLYRAIVSKQQWNDTCFTFYKRVSSFHFFEDLDIEIRLRENTNAKSISKYADNKMSSKITLPKVRRNVDPFIYLIKHIFERSRKPLNNIDFLQIKFVHEILLFICDFTIIF